MFYLLMQQEKSSSPPAVKKKLVDISALKRRGIDLVVRDLACHLISLNAGCLWVTPSAIPGLHNKLVLIEIMNNNNIMIIIIIGEKYNTGFSFFF